MEHDGDEKLSTFRRNRLAILVNSTPKYYYLLPLFVELLYRYGGILQMPDVVLATEVPDHPAIKALKAAHEDLIVLQIPVAEAGFLDSRAAALRILRAGGEYDYVLPLQEDFLLDRAPDWQAIDLAVLPYLEKGDVASVRLMPCPGPQRRQSDKAAWWELDRGADTYGFTFQATVWRLDACADFYAAMCERLERMAPRATTPPARRIELEVRANFAENADGQRFFWEFFAARGQRHLAWRRAGPWPNAVYLCPWPYRPTAIVRGRLEDWARDLAKREGVPLAES
jgi:hypothetical protein